MEPTGGSRSAALLGKLRSWIPPIATASVIGAILGWVSVPNAMTGLDTPGEQARVALATAIAAGLASIWAARVRPRSSFKAARRLFLGTLVLGAIALPAVRATFFFDVGSRFGAAFGTPVGLPFWPWLMAGTALWSGAMRFLEPNASDLVGGRFLLGPRVRVAGVLGLTVILIVVTATFAGTQLRRLGTAFPEAPKAHPPTVIGIIVAVTKDSSEGPIALQGGQIISKPLEGTNLGNAPSTGVGDLYLRGDGWFIDLAPGCGSHLLPAWDRGDYILLSNGLLLRKAPGFRGGEFAFSYLDERIYSADFGGFCLDDKGELVSYRQ